MLVSMSCFLFETGLEYAIFPIGTENNNENIITSFFRNAVSKNQGYNIWQWYNNKTKS